MRGFHVLEKCAHIAQRPIHRCCVDTDQRRGLRPCRIDCNKSTHHRRHSSMRHYIGAHFPAWISGCCQAPPGHALFLHGDFIPAVLNPILRGMRLPRR